MVYGVLRFINFAHSDVLMLGAFAAFFLAPVVGTMFPAQSYLGATVIIILSAAICAAIGMLIELLAYRPLRNRPKLTVLITAIGVSLFIEFTCQHNAVFGARTRPVPKLIPDHNCHLGSLVIGTHDIVVPVVAAPAEVTPWKKRTSEPAPG